MSLDWKAYWAERPALNDGSVEEMLAQVGKTMFGKPVSTDELDLLVDHVAARLDLSPQTVALDLGCGNGLVTSRLAERVAAVVGIDYSPTLVADAQRHSQLPNVRYLQADLSRPSTVDLSRVDLPAIHSAVPPFDAAWSIEVVQNLDPDGLTALLHWLTTIAKPGFRLLASGIPDIERIREFYDTEERWQHHLDNESQGREQMGRWWSRAEVLQAADSAGYTAEIGELPERYYTARYRFDALFRWWPS
jgi:trans-aconitate methyltransferase